jgi:hypothetical protein
MTKPSHEGAAIILLGSFNPGIFQPDWLASQNLISSDEATAATEKEDFIVSSDGTAFSTGWLQLQVTSERLQAVTHDPTSFLSLRDFVAGTLVVLEHTPCKQLGLDYLADYLTPSDSEWHSFGDKLAPKEAWRPLFAEGRIGMRSLVIEGPPLQGEGQLARIKLEPSMRLQPKLGIYLQTNLQIQTAQKHSEGTADLVQRLNASWEGWIEYSRGVMEKLQGA